VITYSPGLPADGVSMEINLAENNIRLFANDKG
jgi:hypothetical protein